MRLQLVVWLAVLLLSASATRAQTVAEAIAARLATAAESMEVAGGRVDLTGLEDFYRATGFAPLWLDDGVVGPRARLLQEVMAEAEREGLEPRDYMPDALSERMAAASVEERAELDLLLSAMLLSYATDLRTGRLEPRRSDPELFAQPRKVDTTAILRQVASEADIKAKLRAMAPSNPPYRRLRRALADYRAMARRGGWPMLEAGPALKPGMRGEAVAVLRRRLLAEGLLTVTSEGAVDLFDAGLELALRQYQRNHLLEADGVLGDKTRAELNQPVHERIRQIALNMERWRWMPDDLGDRYVLVNMASYELDVVDAGRITLNMRVVVGKPYRRTPVFSDRIRYMELHPVWHVPVKIASQDLLPKELADPGYLSRNGFKVLSDWSAEATELDPASIDWQQFQGRRLPYKLEQAPGAKNALGRVKFMFPNKHNVYLHDTAAPELFARTRRSFSSGCIRVEKPLDLAALLLSDLPGWTRPAVEGAFADGKTRVVRLAEPVPVHLTYATVWLGEGGTLHFAPDIYDRDRALYAALYR